MRGDHVKKCSQISCWYARGDWPGGAVTGQKADYQQLFSLNQTVTILPCQLAHFVSTINTNSTENS